ncbi:Flavonoid 4'-O-methyltransferase [Spatholobus suberectus]|nr:Flavonoid 4'-O-methyltransferase [Spatholobus suberectus]
MDSWGDPRVYEIALGTRFWGLIEKPPTYLSLFTEGMASDSQMVVLALKNCTLVFKELDSIMDVGGGTGTTARIICKAFPRLKCVVLDLPQVVANLTGSDNLSFVSGDMFKFVPKVDAILLKV